MDELNKLNRELDALDLTDFERETLIPMVIDRIGYYLDTFKLLLPICDNPENAQNIDAAVRKVVADPRIDPSVPVPQAGAIYLAALKDSINSYWIKELTAFKNDYPDSAAVDSGKLLFQMCQRVQGLAGSIVWCKTRLLSYSLRCFPQIRNKETGLYESDAPKDIEIILYPIRGYLDEMESSASSLIETIREWSRNKRDTRKEYISYLSALQQTRSAKILNWFQVLVIIFTVILTLGSGRIVSLVRDLLTDIIGTITYLTS